jgi:cytochrome P450
MAKVRAEFKKHVIDPYKAQNPGKPVDLFKACTYDRVE